MFLAATLSGPRSNPHSRPGSAIRVASSCRTATRVLPTASLIVLPPLVGYSIRCLCVSVLRWSVGGSQAPARQLAEPTDRTFPIVHRSDPTLRRRREGRYGVLELAVFPKGSRRPHRLAHRVSSVP